MRWGTGTSAGLQPATHDPFASSKLNSAREVDADASGAKGVAVRWEPRPLDASTLTHPGVYCLRSNQTDRDAETMWCTYIMLTALETVFRWLKSDLGLTPIFHQTQQRSKRHPSITALAYQLVRAIRPRLREPDEHAPWATLRSTLAAPHLVTPTFGCADGRTLHVLQATQSEPQQPAIYDPFCVASPPCRNKMIFAAFVIDQPIGR